MTVRYHTLLSADEQQAFGIPDPCPVAVADRVHHDELDALMHVNNVCYFVWFERLRVRFMEHYEIGDLGDPNCPRTVIRSGEIRYHEEMFAGQDYVITTRATAFRTTSYSLEQVIWAEGRKRATYHCVMVLLDAKGAGRHPLHDETKARLQKDGARAEA